jgi:hypothetical protein
VLKQSSPKPPDQPPRLGGAQGKKNKNHLIVGNKLPDIFWATACPRGTNAKHHVPLSGRLLQGSMGSNVPKPAIRKLPKLLCEQREGLIKIA